MPKIEEFLGYVPPGAFEDTAELIVDLRRKAKVSYERLGQMCGICADTLVNLKNGRYQPTRRTYEKLKAFAQRFEK